ncbi:MAG: PEP-CTERM sorting domain-containing protein, partial [Limisphaerales bacterium]
SLLTTIATQGQILFQDNFDSTPAGNWIVNAGSSQDQAVIGFDYSTVGIPAAPNSSGTTVGALLQANRPGGTAALSGVSISPLGQSFTGDYQLRYDLWQNYNGPLGPSPVGGTGSTQLTAGGIMTAGDVPHFAGSGDGLWFAATGDGGSTLDYRVYYRGNNQATASLYEAGGQNNSAAHYSVFGGESAPAGQVTAFPSQTGSTQAGAVGMDWRDVVVTKTGNVVTWDIDGVRIATVDVSATGVTFGGDNILFAHADINSAQTTAGGDPMLFGLIDNVRVTVVPEPSTYALFAMAGAVLLAARRPRQS